MTENAPTSSRLLQPQGVTLLGMVVNALLSAGKIAAGLIFFSQAILVDGLHSASDLITDVAVLAGLRVSNKPADRDHHYGHRRVDTLVALFVGVLLLVAAIWIVYRAIVALHRPCEPVRGVVPLVLALVSVVAKETLYQLTRLVGQRTGSVALKANAWHHRTDAFSSAAAAAGLAGVAIGGGEWQFLDAGTAMVLGAFLAVVSLKIMHRNASELIDRAPGNRTLATLEAAVAGTRGVRDHHGFRARQIGGRVAMDIHIQVDPELTVREGHDIATEVRRQVMAAHPRVIEVIVHIEPAEEGA